MSKKKSKKGKPTASGKPRRTGGAKASKRPAPKRPARPSRLKVRAVAATPSPVATIGRPWSVAPTRIEKLSDVELNGLMSHLLLAEARRAGADVTRVIVNNQLKAGDEGCDAESPAATPSEWLGEKATCWQLKAGGAGMPSRLRGEAKKPIPRAFLARGDRFVVIASECSNGSKGEADRLKQLTDDARAVGIKKPNIDVLGSERLATWVSEHPAVAEIVAPLGGPWATLEHWLNDPHHKNPWSATSDQVKQVAATRA